VGAECRPPGTGGNCACMRLEDSRQVGGPRARCHRLALLALSLVRLYERRAARCDQQRQRNEARDKLRHGVGQGIGRRGVSEAVARHGEVSWS
jgi:hypothetical protein